MRYLFLLALLLTFLVTPQTALACTPPVGGLPNYTTADRTNAAQVVVNGTVLSVQTNPATYRDLAVIKVTSYLKGIGPEIIAVNNYGPSQICLSPVSAGQVGIFFINGDEATGYTANYLSQFDAVTPNDEASLQEALAASGQAARTDFTSPASGTPPANVTPVITQIVIATPTVFAPLPPIPLLTPTPLPAVSSELLLLGAGGGMGLLCGVLIGLALAFGFVAFRRRNE
ncbi:MAG: hypothetical protein JNL09_02135 [Anaerolineales bacterium]|nr:hypothetical protein [Anaerolineales bacterium]